MNVVFLNFSYSKCQILLILANPTHMSEWTCQLRPCRSSWVLEYLRLLENQSTLTDSQRAMKYIFEQIAVVVEQRELGAIHPKGEEFHSHVLKNLIYSADIKKHLPIPVYTFTMPTLVNQFLLHIMLSLGKFDTELDLLLHPSLRESLRTCHLIGPSDKIEDLQEYSNKLCRI